MKRIYSLLWALPVLLVSALFLTSCVYDPYYDEGRVIDNYYNNSNYDGYGDRGRARVVSGEWQGDFGMFYAVVNPITGQSVQFDSRNSYVLFQPNYYGASAGWGKQIDFYEYGPSRAVTTVSIGKYATACCISAIRRIISSMWPSTTTI